MVCPMRVKVPIGGNGRSKDSQWSTQNRSLGAEYTPAANASGGRMNRSLLYPCLVFVSIGGSLAQNQPEKLKMPGPELQNFMLGTWRTEAHYERTAAMRMAERRSAQKFGDPAPEGCRS